MIPVIDNLDALPWQVRQAMEQIEVSVGSSWNRNHRSDGSHGHMVRRSESLATDSVITPSQLTVAVNNFEPAGLADAAMLRLSSDASRNITGLAAPTTNKYLDLWNIGAQDIVLIHESTASLAQNRIRCPGAANLTVNADDAVTLWYDLLINRWRVRGV